MDLLYGSAMCLVRKDRPVAQGHLENCWSSEDHALATLSVRTGFDLVLQRLALPRNSEILVSAITVRDMVSIIEHHGLRAIPVDMDPESCSLRCDLLTQAITPRSKAILVAHLFGSRMDMVQIIEMARHHNLYVFEDCAQAYAADGYRGHSDSDVAMFSFGPIKTATALGGAMLSFRDPQLCDAVKALQRQYPVQSRKLFLKRVLKYSFLKALSYRLPYSIFVALCKVLRTTHDRVISAAVRGFGVGDLPRKIRYQPSYPLLALLHRRLCLFRKEHLQDRIHNAKTLVSLFLSRVPIVGRHAKNHSHWVFPIQSEQPDRLVRFLWKQGLDATRGTSSLYAVPATGGGPDPKDARLAIDHIVYLPFDSGAGQADLRRLAEAVVRFEAGTHSLPAAVTSHG